MIVRTLTYTVVDDAPLKPVTLVKEEALVFTVALTPAINDRTMVDFLAEVIKERLLKDGSTAIEAQALLDDGPNEGAL